MDDALYMHAPTTLLPSDDVRPIYMFFLFSIQRNLCLGEVSSGSSSIYSSIIVVLLFPNGRM